MKNWSNIAIIGCLILITLGSCKKDQIIENPSSLSFSVDTVVFDTVFTQRGTATRNFKVYNSSNKTLKIASIRLANPNTPFRINVDGMAGRSFTDVEILPNDSMYVFVEATIDPNGGNTPMIVTDSILFEIDGRVKDVDLVAWGQDANYIYPETGKPYSVLPARAVWNKNKPYVVYGYAVVDTDNSLVIEAGTKIHFHASSGLWVFQGGSIRVKGTKEEPVVFQGDRLEPAYKDVPGQWDRILINEGAVNNSIEYAIIKNAIIGLEVEALALENPAPQVASNQLILKNTIIQNHSALGIFARNYNIDAENVVVGNAGQYSIGITGGGTYNFRHITVANYFGQANRNTPSFYISNAYVTNDVKYVYKQKNSSFTNCIFYGSIETEFDFANVDNALGFTLQNCLIKRKNALSGSNFSNLIYNQDPKFKDVSAFDYHLLSGSPAINQGIFTSTTTDLDQNFRIGNPDLGAYESQP